MMARSLISNKILRAVSACFGRLSGAFVLFSLCLCGPVAAADGFQRALRDALANDERVRVAAFEIEERQGLTQQTRSSRGFLSDATLAGSVDQTSAADRNSRPVYRSSARLNVSKQLYDGGQSRLRVSASRFQEKAAEAALDRVRQDLILEVGLIYIRHAFLKSAEQIRAESVKLLENQLNAATARKDAGYGTVTDIAFANAQFAQANAGLSAVRSQISETELKFLRRVGAPVGAYRGAFVFPDPLLPATLEHCVDTALTANPDIAVSNNFLDATIQARKAAQKRFGLKVTSAGFVDTSRTEGGLYTPPLDRDSIGASLNLTIPLGTGGARKGALQAAFSAESSRRLELQRAKRDLETNIKIAWEELRLARAQLGFVQTAVDASELAFEGAVKERDAGIRTTVDVLNAERSLLNARLRLLDASNRIDLAKMRLLRLTGLMNTLLGTGA